MRGPRLGRIYERLAGDRFVKGLGGFRGRRVVKVRSLLPRRLQPTVRLVGGGVRLRITNDPLDAQIARSVTGVLRSVYFPSSVGDPNGVGLVLEIGAHHGIYTAVAARVYRSARIVAVEPSLDALTALRRQVAENEIGHRVEIVPAAIAERPGVAVLSHERSGSWGATLGQPDSVIATESVVTLKLTDVLGDRVPDVVKCNAEGAEFDVAVQIGELAGRPRTLVIAVHPEFGDVDELRRRMRDLEYSVDEAVDGERPVWVCVHDEAAAGPSDRPAAGRA